MVCKEDLEEQFSVLGVQISEKILDKCVEICHDHNVTEEELVEIWISYSVSNLNGADPTFETITQMERKEFAKKDIPAKAAYRQTKHTPKSFTKASPKLLIYNNSAESQYIDKEDNILDAYNTTPKAKGRPANRNESSPDGPRLSRYPFQGRSPSGAFSPAGYSPAIATPSRRYAERQNAGETVQASGDNAARCTWRNDPASTFTPTVGLFGRDVLSANARYMFEKVTEEVSEQDNQIDYVAGQIMKKRSLADVEQSNIPFQDFVVTYGRIANADDGRMSCNSVLLEGSTSTCRGIPVPLRLDALRQYSLFPGQTVVVRASNPTGRMLLAETVFDETALPLPQVPHFTAKDGSMHIVVAAGPFTQMDTMNYQPLEDLIQYVLEHRPHVLILIGPFVDSAHKHVADGLLADTFDAHFEKILEGLAEQIKPCNTQVVLVPSWRDAHHQMVYPTPPYSPRKCPSNVTLVSDPSLVDIQGVIVGVTSTDIVMHLAGQEISQYPGGSNRLDRLAKHLLSQQCFYPLYPPAEELNVDSALFALYAHMDVKPHILVLPSDMKYFIKEIDGCVVVNPEHLAKGNVGGTFARFEILPPSTDKKETFVKNISCNIVKI